MNELKDTRLTETTIASGIRILGDLQGRSNVHVEGTLEGDITVEGIVYVGENGKVTGNISATSVTVEGHVQGSIDSVGKVHLGGKAELKGNIKSRGLSVEEGARLEGRISDVVEDTESVRGSMTQYAEAPVYQ